MSAIVCGKRSFFEGQQLHGSSSPPASSSSSSSKRVRCSSSPIRLSPPRLQLLSPVGHLAAIFPGMDKLILERALEECGNDLDSAIKSLNELFLGSMEINEDDNKGATSGGAAGTHSYEGPHPSTACEFRPAIEQPLSLDGSEWVELFVGEMVNASDVDDARTRAARALQMLEKSIQERAGAEVNESLQKENLMLREQVEVLVKDNAILKRAVAIQHERQKELDEKTQELQHLRQLASQYQEQLRTLEVNNYALTMHLKQAQQSSSIPGRFNPDIF